MSVVSFIYAILIVFVSAGVVIVMSMIDLTGEPTIERVTFIIAVIALTHSLDKRSMK